MGFCPAAEIAPHAFTAGMAASMTLLPNTNLDEQGLDKVSSLPRFQELERVLQTYRDSPLEFEDKSHFNSLKDFATHFSAEKHSRKLQSRIMATIRGEKMDELEEKVTPEQWAHPTCRANKDIAHLCGKHFPYTGAQAYG